MHRTAYAVALAIAAGSLAACSGDTGQTAATATATRSASWSFSPPMSLPATSSPRPPSIGPTAEPSPPAATPTDLPVGFLGSWNMDKAACGSASEGRLTIEPRRITFYESSGPITSVSRKGGIVTITATLTGEGTTWVEARRFRLSADGATLTDLSTDTVRHRCP